MNRKLEIEIAFNEEYFSRRFTSNASLFDELVKKVHTLRYRRVSIGGNAASIARRFAIEGFNVLLGSTSSTEMQNLFPDNLQSKFNTCEYPPNFYSLIYINELFV